MNPVWARDDHRLGAVWHIVRPDRPRLPLCCPLMPLSEKTMFRPLLVEDDILHGCPACVALHMEIRAAVEALVS
jgi:hypothetical protein